MLRGLYSSHFGAQQPNHAQWNHILAWNPALIHLADDQDRTCHRWAPSCRKRRKRAREFIVMAKTKATHPSQSYLSFVVALGKHNSAWRTARRQSKEETLLPFPRTHLCTGGQIPSKELFCLHHFASIWSSGINAVVPFLEYALVDF